MRRVLIAGAAVAVLLVVLFLWVWPHEPVEVVRFGYHKISANLPLYVALDKGFFSEWGVTVKPVVVKRTEEQVNALLTGDLDAAAGSGLSYLYLVEQKDPGELKIVLPLVEDDKHYSNYLLVRRDSDIASPDELAGR